MTGLNNVFLSNTGGGARIEGVKGAMEMQESGTTITEDIKPSKDVKEDRKPGTG